MIRRPPRSTRTDTLFPYTTLFRSRPRCPPDIGRRLGSELGRKFPPGRPGHEPVGRLQPVERQPEFRTVAHAVGAIVGMPAGKRLGLEAKARPCLLQSQAEIHVTTEESSVGKEVFNTCRSRRSQY